MARLSSRSVGPPASSTSFPRVKLIARRLLVVLSLAALLGVSFSLAGVGGDHAHAGRPSVRPARLNVVVILSDDQRYDVNRLMPHVEHLLAAKGVTFTHAFVTTSECCPSRAGILTGQYSHHNGVVQNFGRANYRHFNQESNLAVWLHNAGYETALVGKFLNDYPNYEGYRIPPGWSDWQAIDSVPEERYYDYLLNENGRRVYYGSAPKDYSTTVLTSKALEFIRGAKSPFFLYFAPVTPHLPATPAPRDIGSVPVPPAPDRPSFNERDLSDKPWHAVHPDRLHPRAIRFLEHDIRQRQLESLRALDRSVARIVDLLRRRSLLDRTVILYMSDNGFLWGEHRLGGKIWPYEESIRVPLVVRVPWRNAWGARDSRMVLNIDLASTIAALTRIQPGLPQDGISFTPLLHRKQPRWRHEFVVEYLGKTQLRSGGPPPFRALRTERYVYVEYLNGWRELYDLRWDPWEDQNVAGVASYSAVEKRLRARLADLFRRPARPVG